MFIIEAVYAYSDYFEAVNIRYYDNPTTCIFEPEYDEDFTTNHLPAVFNGIKEWEKILTKATGGDWYIPVVLYEWEHHINKGVHDYLNCDILITFEETNDQNIVGQSALGFNYYNHSWSKHKYSHIVVFSNVYHNAANATIDLGVVQDGDEITITITPKSLEYADMHHIVKHEWGHAVGVLHHFNTSTVTPKSVMHPTFEPFTDYYMEIQPRDVYAITQLYGEDGWGRPNPAVISKHFAAAEYFIPAILIEDLRYYVNPLIELPERDENPSYNASYTRSD